MYRLARFVLGPLLYVQGKRLMSTIPRLPEASGAREGTRGDGPALRLLVVGDSSAAGVGAETQDEALLGRLVAYLSDAHRVAYRLVARNGSTIPRTLRHLRQLPPTPYDIAVTSVGLNDLIAGRSLKPWLASYRDLVEELQTRFEASHVFVSGLPPIGKFPALPQPLRWVLGQQARHYDATLRDWIAEAPRTTYIGLETTLGDRLHGASFATIMASDGFHPGPQIYDVWAERVARHVHLDAAA